MGVKGGTKENIHENVHVFVLYVNFKHESTKTCMFPCTLYNYPLSAYFYPPPHFIIMVRDLWERFKYGRRTLHPKATRRKSRTLVEMGAEPVMI